MRLLDDQGERVWCAQLLWRARLSGLRGLLWRPCMIKKKEEGRRGEGGDGTAHAAATKGILREVWPLCAFVGLFPTFLFEHALGALLGLGRTFECSHRVPRRFSLQPSCHLAVVPLSSFSLLSLHPLSRRSPLPRPSWLGPATPPPADPLLSFALTRGFSRLSAQLCPPRGIFWPLEFIELSLRKDDSSDAHSDPSSDQLPPSHIVAQVLSLVSDTCTSTADAGAGVPFGCIVTADDGITTGVSSFLSQSPPANASSHGRDAFVAARRPPSLPAKSSDTPACCRRDRHWA